jgi:hypothetical protein
MRSGWPHTQDDHGRLPVAQRQAPFGPEISWPTGYSGLEYRDGDYRYQAPQVTRPPAGQGEHPYAAFSAAGYGDDGYRDPGYDGPASQDAGIPGTRTVRGFVEPGQERADYGQGGYASPGYGDSGRIEVVYPNAPTMEAYPAAEAYRQPWDYDQPLRYEGEDTPHQAQDGHGSGAYRVPAYDPADYNGSEYSMPGVNGPGYDLSGIIGTGDFESVGYDEPSYGRLSYDDPRYDDGSGYRDSRYNAPRDDARGAFRSDETRLDLLRFDETRLDSLWLTDSEISRGDPVGYENDGFGGDGPVRSDYSGSDRAGSGRFDETRLDLNTAGLGPRLDQTRFDMPVFDETRVDNARAFGAAAGLHTAATGLLAPPEGQPLSWAEETSLDAFSDLNLDEELAQAPAAFVRTAERPDTDTGARRAVGRRRGRSGDRRQWMALGAIAVVAAGAIGGVLMKYVFSGPSGPAHKVVAPEHVDAFTRMPNLEKQMKVGSLAEEFTKASAGHVSDVVPAVYQEGSTAPGGNAQIFMFVGGKLAGAAPATSVASFTQSYPGAKVVPAGTLGGEAACSEAKLNGQSVAMCVWFDNDSFGALVSPTMTTAKLATTLDQVRPSLELYAK